MASKRVPTGFVFYRGPSTLDGKPVVGVCLVGQSTNKKTGTMAQTYIIREDVHPVDAVNTGEDSSICGNCTHRKIARDYIDKRGKKRHGIKRTCYVNLGHGPTAVYSGLKRGIYPDASPELLARLRGRMLRLGTYGDPVAIPKSAWEPLLGAGITGHTGYTHQWHTVLGGQWIGKLMASVDSALERVRAQSNGWKTFSVINSTDTHADAQSGQCPGSGEYKARTGRIVQCQDCRLCNGSRASIAIRGHGIGWVDQATAAARVNLL